MTQLLGVLTKSLHILKSYRDTEVVDDLSISADSSHGGLMGLAHPLQEGSSTPKAIHRPRALCFGTH